MYVFETFNKAIQQIKDTDIPERAILLQRVQRQLKDTVKTWKILSNQATIYGLNQTKQDQKEISELKNKLSSLIQQKKSLIKERDDLNKEYDQEMIKTKNDITKILAENEKEVEKYKQQQASNTQILQEYKSAQ